VSEWIGWVIRLMSTIRARMEEMSLRSGAATVAGVFAVAATAVLLTLIQGGHHAAVARTAQAGPAQNFSVPAPPVSAPRLPPATHPATHAALADAPDVRDAPEHAKTPTAAPQASPSPSLGLPMRTPAGYPAGAGSPATPQPGWSPSWSWPTPAPSQTWAPPDQPG
jgi:hypothetical protein